MKYKLKTFMASCATCFMLSTSPLHASGMPTIDIAVLTQDLINYLTMIQQLEDEINNTKATIDHLRAIEVPTFKDYELIQILLRSLNKKIEEYNKTVGEYNTASEFYEELKSAEENFLKCQNQKQLCTKEEIIDAKKAKLQAINRLYEFIKKRTLNYNIQNPNLALNQEIQQNEAYINKILMNKNSVSAGEAQNIQIKINAMLLKQIMQLRHDLATARSEDLKLKYQEFHLDYSTEKAELMDYANEQ